MKCPHLSAKTKKIGAALGIVLLAACLCILSSDAVNGRWAFFQPKTITVNGSEVVVDDSLNLNTLTEEDFSCAQNGRANYLSGESRTGVDVSSHQGEIDWKSVASDGIQFAMLRVGYRGFTEGGIQEDEAFLANARGALGNGLEIGVYFFSQATTEAEAEEEADFVLEKIKDLKVTLPVVFDWERIDEELADGSAVRTESVTKEEATACALAFCQRIAEAGKQPMLYLNNDTGYFSVDISQLQDYPVWFASYETGWPNYYYAVELWQYTQTGTVAGITGSADLSIWPVQSVEPAETGTGSASGS